MHDLSHQMMAMQSLLLRQLMKGLDSAEISAGQPKVLAYLKSHEGHVQKEVAAACLLEPGSLTVLLNRMQKQGMIERRYRDSDRRARCIYLTEHGRALAEQVVVRFYEVEEMAFSGISEEERELFLRVCDKVADNLKAC